MLFDARKGEFVKEAIYTLSPMKELFHRERRMIICISILYITMEDL
jgi:hypothetical protein